MSRRTLGKIPGISRMTNCYLYSYHKILLCLHGSLVQQDFYVPTEMEIQGVRSGERGARLLGLYAQSVAKGVIQVDAQDLVARLQVGRWSRS